MKKRALLILLFAVVLVLGGCSWLGFLRDEKEEQVSFTATVVRPLTVVVDGRGPQWATRWTWDWGDGTTTQGGKELQVARHTYAEPGRYVIVLTLEREGEDDSGGGLPPPPGPGPGNPPSSDGSSIQAAYQVVDLTNDTVRAVIIVIDGLTSIPRGENNRVFWAWWEVVFYAGASKGERPLWYQWELTCISGPPPEMYVQSFYGSGETFSVRIPGPSCNGPRQVWTWRVWLQATDKHGNRSEAELLVYTTN